MANDIDYSPIEKYNKAIEENRRELENNTRSLRSPFKKLIGTISETNQEMAKIATDSIKGTQDTWKGLLTEGKKEREIRKAHNQAYKDVSKHVEDSLERTAKTQTEYQIASKKFSDKEEVRNREREDMAADDLRFQAEKRKIEEQLNSNLTESKLNALVEQEKALNKDIKLTEERNSIRKTQLDDEEKIQQREFTIEQRNFEDSLRAEKENREEQEKAIADVNTALEHRLEELSSTEKYDKFTNSIKELTGGIVDIEGVLDPIAKKFGALKDLGATFGITGENMKKGFGKFKSMFKMGEDSGDSIKEKTADLVSSMSKSEKKSSKGFGKLIKTLGLTGLALLGLILIVRKLMDTFPRFGNWMRRLMGLDEIPDATKAEFDELSDKDKVDPEVGGELIDQQKERLDIQDQKDGVFGLDRANENVSAAGQIVNAAGTAAQGPGTIASKFVEGYKDGGARYNSAGQLVDDNMKYRKPITTGEKLIKGSQEALKQSPRSIAGGGLKLLSKAAAPAAVLLTGFEIKRNLDESDDMRGTLDVLLESQQITEEQHEEFSGYIDEKEREDVIKPVTSAAAGFGSAAVAAKLAAPLLAAGPFGWLGYGLIVAGAGLFGSAVADKAVDVSMTGDDKINDALDEYDMSFDTDDIKSDLNEMELDAESAAARIANQTQELNDLGNNGASAAEIANAVQVVTDAKTTTTSHHYGSGDARQSGTPEEVGGN